jgi:hypothetical protein
MIDTSKFKNQDFVKRAQALPFSEVVRHASVVIDNESGVPAIDTESFTGVCLELVRAASERLRIVEPRVRFYVQGRRWNDRNGNTYHSVRISDANMDELAFLPFSYGYGDHWKQTALEWFVSSGYLPDAKPRMFAPSLTLRETLRAECSVMDVRRKRDL